MPIVSLGSAIQADANSDAQLVKQSQILIVQADAISLHADVDRDTGTDFGADGAYQVSDQITSGQQWLSAVEDQGDTVEAMRPDVLADAHGRALGDLIRHAPGSTAP
jgi:hypothetical protein